MGLIFGWRAYIWEVYIRGFNVRKWEILQTLHLFIFYRRGSLYTWGRVDEIKVMNNLQLPLSIPSSISPKAIRRKITMPNLLSSTKKNRRRANMHSKSDVMDHLRKQSHMGPLVMPHILILNLPNGGKRMVCYLIFDCVL